MQRPKITIKIPIIITIMSLLISIPYTAFSNKTTCQKAGNDKIIQSAFDPKIVEWSIGCPDGFLNAI